MDEPKLPENLLTKASSASLIDRLASRLVRDDDGVRGGIAEARATVGAILIAICLAASGVAVGAQWQSAVVQAETRALKPYGEQRAHDRERAAGLAQAFGQPLLDTQLATLRAHLPPGVRLAELSRDEDGRIALAIDTSDPDLLRTALAADARFARFREHAQETREDGMIRVRLVEQ